MPLIPRVSVARLPSQYDSESGLRRVDKTHSGMMIVNAAPTSRPMPNVEIAFSLFPASHQRDGLVISDVYSPLSEDLNMSGRLPTAKLAMNMQTHCASRMSSDIAAACAVSNGDDQEEKSDGDARLCSARGRSGSGAKSRPSRSLSIGSRRSGPFTSTCDYSASFSFVFVVGVGDASLYTMETATAIDADRDDIKTVVLTRDASFSGCSKFRFSIGVVVVIPPVLFSPPRSGTPLRLTNSRYVLVADSTFLEHRLHSTHSRTQTRPKQATICAAILEERRTDIESCFRPAETLAK